MAITYRNLKLFGVCGLMYTTDIHGELLYSRFLDRVAAWMVNCSELKEERNFLPIVSAYQIRRPHMSEDYEHTL